MRVEARYCDVCGIKIAGDELASGDAIQLEESVFHCKDCKEKAEKAASKKKDEKGDERASEKGASDKGASAKGDEKKSSEKKALTSSRRLLTRRLGSGRLAKSKAKIPAALTSSSDGEKVVEEGEKKRVATERAKTRDKLEKKKSKTLDLEKKKKKGDKKKAKKSSTADAEADGADEVTAKRPDADAQAGSDDAKADAVKAEAKAQDSDAEKSEAEKDAKADKKADKKTEKAEKPEILNTDSPPSSLTDSPPESNDSDVATAVAEAAKEGSPQDSDASDAAKTTVVEGSKKKKDKKARDKEEKEGAEKDAADDEERISSAKTVVAAKNLLTGSGKKAARDDDDTSATRKKDKKKSGGGTALAEANDADESAERKKAGLKPKTKKASRPDQAALEGAPPKKKGLPVVPLIAVGVLACGLVGVAVVLGSGGGAAKIPPYDRTALVDDLKKYSDEHPNDREEVVARWEGLKETLDGELQGRASQEIEGIEQRFQNQARSALDDVEGKVTHALEKTPHDFDAALGAIAAFPPQFRAGSEWLRRGPALELDVLKRRAAFRQGSALLKAAKESWEKDHSARVLSGLLTAFPSEYRETEEGKAILQEFEALRNSAVDEEIKGAGVAADEAAKRREEEKYKKLLADRNQIEEGANVKEQKELGTDQFEWQVRDDDRTTGESIKGAYKFGNGKLTVTNTNDQAIIIGKNKRDWGNFTLEFKIKVKKGTQVWFLGHVWGNERAGFDGHYDKLTLCNTSNEQDKTPHTFTGISEEQWCTVKYRCLGKSVYDVVVDGKETFRCRKQLNGGGDTGGFGFLVGKGECEIEGVKAKVISRKWDAVGSDED